MIDLMKEYGLPEGVDTSKFNANIIALFAEVDKLLLNERAGKKNASAPVCAKIKMLLNKEFESPFGLICDTFDVQRNVSDINAFTFPSTGEMKLDDPDMYLATSKMMQKRKFHYSVYFTEPLLTDTQLNLTTGELVAILIHEIGHNNNQAEKIDYINSEFWYYIKRMIPGIGSGVALSTVGLVLGIPTFGILTVLTLRLAAYSISRSLSIARYAREEIVADNYSMQYGLSQVAISGLKKMVDLDSKRFNAEFPKRRKNIVFRFLLKLIPELVRSHGWYNERVNGIIEELKKQIKDDTIPEKEKDKLIKALDYVKTAKIQESMGNLFNTEICEQKLNEAYYDFIQDHRKNQVVTPMDRYDWEMTAKGWNRAENDVLAVNSQVKNTDSPIEREYLINRLQAQIDISDTILKRIQSDDETFMAVNKLSPKDEGKFKNIKRAYMILLSKLRKGKKDNEQSRIQTEA